MSTATAEIPMHQKVQSFVAAPRKRLIGGQWLDSASGKTFPTYNPATGEVLARVAEGDQADVEASIPGISSAIFFNHGQCCCAGSRLFVEKGIFDKVVEGVAADAKKIKVGPVVCAVPFRCGVTLRWLQAIGLGARDGPRCAGTVHRGESRHRAALMGVPQNIG